MQFNIHTYTYTWYLIISVCSKELCVVLSMLNPGMGVITLYIYIYIYYIYIYIIYIYIYIIYIYIKTHNSESRGQEEAGRTQRTSELFIGINKPP